MAVYLKFSSNTFSCYRVHTVLWLQASSLIIVLFWLLSWQLWQLLILSAFFFHLCSLSRRKSNQNACQHDYQCIFENSLLSSLTLFSPNKQRKHYDLSSKFSLSSIGLFALLPRSFWTFTCSIQRLVVYLCGSKVSWCLQMVFLIKKRLHKADTFALTRTCKDANKCVNQTIESVAPCSVQSPYIKQLLEGKLMKILSPGPHM